MANYYISDVLGSSSNPGTMLLPWTKAKHDSFDISPGFSPDDNIFWYKGETYSGVLNIHSAGTSGHPITHDLWGTATDNAVIDGGGTTATPVITWSGNFLVFNNLVFQNNGHANGVVYFPPGCHDITFHNCCAFDGIRGFYGFQCGSGGVANILIDIFWTKNIADNNSHTHGGGSHMQMNEVTGAGLEVRYGKSFTDMGLSDAARLGVGDILNFYKVNGTSGSPAAIHHCMVRGGSSYAPGEAGIILGDLGGSFQTAHDNILIETGAVGAQIQGGHDIDMSNNIIYGPAHSYTFDGLQLGNYSGAACYNITMANNLLNWRNGFNNGGAISNFFIDRSGNSTSTGVSGGAALADPTGWGTNGSFGTANAGAYDALLANPLFNDGDWNTVTGGGGPVPQPFYLPIAFA